MLDGERRRLVYVNLLNGLSVEQVMVALHLSEKQVLDDFAFCSTKVRSYRFERAMPLVECATLAQARANRAEILYTLTRLNLGKDAAFSKIATLPLTADGGRMGEGEIALIEMQMKHGGGRR